jgi:LacI family transcriptional regulator
VPQDISVIGCDDIFGADFCSPPLTTFAAPIEQAGRLATDMLMSVIQDRWGGRLAGGVEGRRHERLPTYLTIRESTGPAPTTARVGGRAS